MLDCVACKEKRNELYYFTYLYIMLNDFINWPAFVDINPIQDGLFRGCSRMKGGGEWGQKGCPDSSPTDTSPTDTSPTDTSPTDTSPTDTSPMDISPTRHFPNGHFPDGHFPDGHFPDGHFSDQTHPWRTLSRPYKLFLFLFDCNIFPNCNFYLRS